MQAQQRCDSLDVTDLPLKPMPLFDMLQMHPFPSPASCLPLPVHCVLMQCWPWCGDGLALGLQICRAAMAWQLLERAFPKLCSPCAGDSQLTHIRSLFLHELPFSSFSISEPTGQSKFPRFIPFPHRLTSQTHAGSS